VILPSEIIVNIEVKQEQPSVIKPVSLIRVLKKQNAPKASDI
jgi:hypothetical protein